MKMPVLARFPPSLRSPLKDQLKILQMQLLKPEEPLMTTFHPTVDTLMSLLAASRHNLFLLKIQLKIHPTD